MIKVAFCDDEPSMLNEINVLINQYRERCNQEIVYVFTLFDCGTVSVRCGSGGILWFRLSDTHLHESVIGWCFGYSGIYDVCMQYLSSCMENAWHACQKLKKGIIRHDYNFKASD